MSRELKKQMKGAKSKTARQAAFKRAAKICSGKSRSKSRSNPKRKSKPKKSRSRSNPNKSNQRRSIRTTLNFQKIYGLIRKGALILPAAITLTGAGTMESKLKEIMRKYTGFNVRTGKWNPQDLILGWGAYLGAILGTVGIPKIASILRGLA